MFKNSGIPISGSLGGNTEYTITNSVVNLTRLITANYAIIQVQDKNVRYFLNGASPTLTRGFIANVGDKITIELSELKAGVKFINGTGEEDTSKVVVQFYTA